MLFSQESIPESLVKKQNQIDKVIQRSLKVTTPKQYEIYIVSTNVEYVTLSILFFFHQTFRD